MKKYIDSINEAINPDYNYINEEYNEAENDPKFEIGDEVMYIIF